MDIAIAGAGLLGRLFAFELAHAGHRVQVFDPAVDVDALGAAGWTAAGMLSPVAELECADAQVFVDGQRSLERWPTLVAALRRHVPAQPVTLAIDGSLLLAHRGDEGVAERILSLLRVRAGADHQPRAMGNDGLRELEPDLHGPAHAWLLPTEGRIHTVQAMTALAGAASVLGVRWHWRSRVDEVLPGRLRVSEATAPNGDALRVGGRAHGSRDIGCELAIDVRGLGARPQLPVRGVRGEIFWLHAPGVRLRRPVRLLHPRHRVYLVPRPDDLVVVGASEIESEDRSPVSLRTTVELLTAAHSMLPELAEARIVHAETNLRPALPDNLPRIEATEGLLRINGLFRHGWLVAPALVERGLRAVGLSSTDPLGDAR
jgi:glycine oxidase